MNKKLFLIFMFFIFPGLTLVISGFFQIIYMMIDKGMDSVTMTDLSLVYVIPGFLSMIFGMLYFINSNIVSKIEEDRGK